MKNNIILVALLSAMVMVGYVGIVSADTVLIDQNFDNEITGSTPTGWIIFDPTYGSFTVDSSEYDGSSGKSGKYVDSSSSGGTEIYDTFSTQTGRLVLECTMKPTAISGLNTYFMLYIDDDTVERNGVNIYFRDGGYIAYYDGSYQNIQSYSANTWYKIKMIIDIPSNTYDIYIDNTLKVKDAHFNGRAAQLSRLNFGGSTQHMAIGYIDDIKLTAITPQPTQTLKEVPVGVDSDGDGWGDDKEKEMGTNPYSVDSDNDGINDPQDPNPTVPEQKTPGFNAIFAIAGLLAVIYLLRKRK